MSEADYLRELQKEISESNCRERVFLRDPVYGEDLKAALGAVDLFVLPSLNENFGNSAAEAVAAGVPVLLTETCGIAPIIQGRAGLAVPLGVESFAEGLRLMMTSDMRDEVTAKREEVKRELSWDEPIEQTETLYKQVIKESRK